MTTNWCHRFADFAILWFISLLDTLQKVGRTTRCFKAKSVSGFWRISLCSYVWHTVDQQRAYRSGPKRAHRTICYGTRWTSECLSGKLDTLFFFCASSRRIGQWYSGYSNLWNQTIAYGTVLPTRKWYAYGHASYWIDDTIRLRRVRLRDMATLSDGKISRVMRNSGSALFAPQDTNWPRIQAW